ncbi:MAG: hypothetical protein OXU23_13265 [Candidatus Poribacteria bacterium]|nr:hypothetical protein [Candidatus Poribacteria bacterium]MDE0317518.1 hypothetical protein [Candidatus Poribacteria bacterium]
MALTVIRTARPSPVWQESYVRVKKGQRLIIDADGAWSPDLQNRTGWCGADGVPKTPAGDGYLHPGTNIGALIAKIGSDVFAVGSRYDNPAPADGVIFLAMNENPNNNNQAGSLLTQIIIFDE